MDSYQKSMLTISIMMAALMQALDTTIANVALPHMQGSLSASQDEINWILTSYITAAAIMTLPTSWLADRFGNKRVFLTSVVGFTISSMLCGLSTSIEEIVLFRIMQGVFGASLIPLSQVMLLNINPPEKHASAMALWGMGIVVGPIIGPSLGGFLTDNYSWRWVFYINIPFGILSFLGISMFSEETKTVSRPFDFIGFFLFAIFLASLQLLLDLGNKLDWFDSFEIKVYLVLSLLSIWLFSFYITWAKNPFISLLLFKDYNLCVSLILIFVVGIILLSTMALLSPFLANLLDYPVITVGMVLVPRGVGTIMAMSIMGKLLERKVDPRILITLGLLLTAFSLYEMTLFNLSVTQAMIVESGFIQGIGLGFIFVPLSTIAFSTLNPIYRTEAAGLYTLLRNIGSSVGVSIIGAILSRNIQINHAIISEHINIFNFNSIIHALSPIISEWDKSKAAILMDIYVNKQAQMIAYLNCFKVMMIVVIVVMPLVLILRNNNIVKPAQKQNPYAK